MWSTETVWFDLAVVFGIFAFGSILFGRFEEHKPRLRRVITLTGGEPVLQADRDP